MPGTWLSRALLSGALLLLPATDVAADSIRLNSLADASDGSVLLRNVAELKGEAAESIGDLVVANFKADEPELVVTLASVRSMLDRRQVNWGRLSLGGYGKCTVYRAMPAEPLAEPDAAPVLSNPDRPIDLDSAVTLQQQVTYVIQRHVGGDPADLVIEFSQADRRKLAKAAVTDRYVIEPLASSSLGRVPVMIRQWHGDTLVATHHVKANVSLRCLAVVAVRSIRKDRMIARSDVEVREILAKDVRGAPIAKLDEVVGKRLSGNLRKGAAVFSTMLRSPLLVRKRELITVYSRCGGIEIRTAARAMEDGERGQLIKACRPGQRDEMVVKVTARRTAQTIAADPPKPNGTGTFNPSTGRMDI